MYRKALDIGLKLVAPTVTGVFKFRISELVKTRPPNRITRRVGRSDSPSGFRLLGNEAAHDIDQPTRDELDALRDFSDLVLQYIFTLPAIVAARRATHSPTATAKP